MGSRTTPGWCGTADNLSIATGDLVSRVLDEIGMFSWLLILDSGDAKGASGATIGARCETPKNLPRPVSFPLLQGIPGGPGVLVDYVAFIDARNRLGNHS